MMRARAVELSTARKVLFAAIVVALLCGTVEGLARIVWWRLERASLRAHYEKGEAVLVNDGINFMKVPDGIYGYTIKPGLRIDSQTTCVSASPRHLERTMSPTTRRCSDTFSRVAPLGFGSTK